MTCFGIGIDEPTRAAIEQTLARLPQDVVAWVRRYCLFLPCGGGIYGETLAIHAWEIFPAYLILLDREAMRGPRAADICAHEIGHAWLDHGQPNDQGADNDEADVDEQVAAWGFSRKEVAS